MIAKGEHGRRSQGGQGGHVPHIFEVMMHFVKFCVK